MDRGDALPMALALFQEPGLRHDWRKRPLPDDMGRLLALVGGEPGRLERAAREVDADPDTLLQAARFYVQEILLFPEADDHRVLGLAPGADAATLKSHYRALQSWLHPDRGEAGRAEAIYASRVNAAWSRLRAGRPVAASGEAEPQVPKPATKTRRWVRIEEVPAAGRQWLFAVPLALAVGGVWLWLASPRTGADGWDDDEGERAVAAIRAMPRAPVEDGARDGDSGAGSIVETQRKAAPVSSSTARASVVPPTTVKDPSAGPTPLAPVLPMVAESSRPVMTASVAPVAHAGDGDVATTTSSGSQPWWATQTAPRQPAPVPAVTARVASDVVSDAGDQARGAVATAAQARPGHVEASPAASGVAMTPAEEPVRAPREPAATQRASGLALATEETAAPAPVLAASLSTTAPMQPIAGALGDAAVMVEATAPAASSITTAVPPASDVVANEAPASVSADRVLQRHVAARQRADDLLAYLTRRQAGTPPIWGNGASLDAAEAIRGDLVGTGLLQRAQVNRDQARWQIGEDRARLVVPVQPADRSGERLLHAGLRWENDAWWVESVRLEGRTH
ncbi:hypothetical protein [Pseudoxanthomonas suwonensis]|uniref:hypothetical protein n=1 Tax=Pseudoxanthomonas suwonensis TaxID=314722 RepID=UPI0012DF2685|nr:hypothetical protein [Pseudoxanthomonas suwonensis]